VYVPWEQDPTFWVVVYLGTREDAPPVPLDAVRATVAALDPGLPVFDAQRLDAVEEASRGTARLALVLVGGYGLIALALTVLGVYAVLSEEVRMRVRELGVRSALGADGSTLLLHVLGRSAAFLSPGIAAGLALGAALVSLARSQLYGVAPWSSGPYLGAGLLLLGVGLAASMVPARRAARLSPAAVLRSD
jgi:ABC-type antimicrobial peptide transport system permease subunit